MRRLTVVEAGDSRVGISYKPEGDRTPVLIEDLSSGPGLDLKRLRSVVADKVREDGVDVEQASFLERDWSGNFVSFKMESRDQPAEQTPEVQAGNAKYQVAGDGARDVEQSEAEQLWGEPFGPSPKQVDQEFRENMDLDKSMWDEPGKRTPSTDIDPTD